MQSDTLLFLTFFIYGADSKPTWFTGQVTQDSSNNFNGMLYSTIGTYYILPWGGFSGGPAGTVSFQPLGPHTAKLIYTVNGVGTVAKTIHRQPLPASPTAPTTPGAWYLRNRSARTAAVGALTVNIAVNQPLNNVGSVSIGMARADGVTCNFTGR